ncbi:MAG TPA: hypothetical protein VMC42_02450 [Methanoregulaceae archaeon]|nr:hypothetical protein [Methanoregulaceae archaeon]
MARRYSYGADSPRDAGNGNILACVKRLLWTTGVATLYQGRIIEAYFLQYL